MRRPERDSASPSVHRIIHPPRSAAVRAGARRRRTHSGEDQIGPLARPVAEDAFDPTRLIAVRSRGKSRPGIFGGDLPGDLVELVPNIEERAQQDGADHDRPTHAALQMAILQRYRISATAGEAIASAGGLSARLPPAFWE